RNVWRGLSSNHRPVNVRHRDVGSEEFNLNFINSQGALPENEDVSIGKLLLDLRTPLPPPAYYVDQVAIFREQGGISFCVVLVPPLPVAVSARGSGSQLRPEIDRY